MLAAIGGVIGIALAEGTSLAVDAFSPLPSRVSLFWVVLAFAALGMTLWVGWLIRDPAGLKASVSSRRDHAQCLGNHADLDRRSAGELSIRIDVECDLGLETQA